MSTAPAQPAAAVPPAVLAKPELLAPAGDWGAMRAAVANGADAVYLGLSLSGVSHFNARHRATNFALGELPQVMAYLHGHNVRGYVTFNTLVFSYELPEAARFVRAVAGAGADAVIVQQSVPIYRGASSSTRTPNRSFASLRNARIRATPVRR